MTAALALSRIYVPQSSGCLHFRALKSLVDPVIGAAWRILFVLVDVDLEALFVALMLPVGDGVADVVQEGSAAQVDVGDQHAAEVADVGDVVTAAAESGEKFDGAHYGHVGAHGDGDRQRDEPDLAVGEKDCVGHEDAEDCAGCADGGLDGKFVAEEEVGDCFYDELDYACTDSADEEEIQEAALAPAEFEVAAEHP